MTTHDPIPTPPLHSCACKGSRRGAVNLMHPYCCGDPSPPLIFAHTHTSVFVEVLKKVFILPQKVQNISFKKTNDSFTNHNIYNFLMVTFVQKNRPYLPKTPLYLWAPYYSYRAVFVEGWNIIIDFAPKLLNISC